MQTNDAIVFGNFDVQLPYINPFWIDTMRFPQAQNMTSLYFLRIRMLELLWNNALKPDKLILILMRSFGYEKSCVNQAIADSRALGWIDSTWIEDNTIVYELSPAGRYLIEDLLYDFDVLYMLALDTRIPSVFLEEGLFLAQTDYFQDNGYTGSAAVTIISFIRYLYVLNLQDQKIIRNEDICDLYAPVILSDKHIASVVKSIGARLGKSSHESREIFNSVYGGLV
jgi:hypothetical protein